MSLVGECSVNEWFGRVTMRGGFGISGCDLLWGSSRSQMGTLAAFCFLFPLGIVPAGLLDLV